MANDGNLAKVNSESTGLGAMHRRIGKAVCELALGVQLDRDAIDRALDFVCDLTDRKKSALLLDAFLEAEMGRISDRPKVVGAVLDKQAG